MLTTPVQKTLTWIDGMDFRYYLDIPVVEGTVTIYYFPISEKYVIESILKDEQIQWKVRLNFDNAKDLAEELYLDWRSRHN